MNNTVTAEQIRELVFGFNSKSQGLLHHTDEYINRFRERVGIDRSEKRLKCLLLFRKHLAKFLRHRYHVDDIPVKKADTALIKDLEEYFAKKRVLNSTLRLVILQCWHPYSRTYTNGTS